ncbi:hypothetical protein LTR86_008979 [Recurvomyces mirabilis]|nr:hypothetical protein LTR86_008979 [Recurvomyces mirabilis]
MTDKLPPNLLALFQPRPPVKYLIPADHAPEDRRTARITGVAAFLPQLNEEFGDYKPTESWLEAKDRKQLEKIARQKHITSKEGVQAIYDTEKDGQIRGDPYKTLFVGRLSYDTDIKDLEKEFGRYGPIDRVRVVINTRDPAKGSGKKNTKGRSRGYAFIIFENEKDMKAAYKANETPVIRGRKVLIDAERGRTVQDWRPRRLGGGLGGRHYTRAPVRGPGGFSGPPSGPGGFRGGGIRGDFRGGFGGRGGGGFRERDGGRNGFGGGEGYGGGRGGGFGGGGFRGGRGGFGGGRGGIGYGGNEGPDGAPAGPRSRGGFGDGGGYGGGRGGGGGRFNDRDSRNANLEPLPPRGGGSGYRDRDGASGGAYAGQKRPYDGGGYDQSRSRPRY